MSWRNTKLKHTLTERLSVLFARKNWYAINHCAIISWCTLTWGPTSARLVARASWGSVVSGPIWSSIPQTRRSHAISARRSSRDRRCWRRTSWRTRAWEDSSATFASIVSTWKAHWNTTYWRITVSLWIFSQLLYARQRKLKVSTAWLDRSAAREIALFISLLLFPSFLYRRAETVGPLTSHINPAERLLCETIAADKRIFRDNRKLGSQRVRTNDHAWTYFSTCLTYAYIRASRATWAFRGGNVFRIFN